MKITVAVENTVDSQIGRPLMAQHGLAMLLDIPDCGRILFDTSRSDVLLKNLLLLDIAPDSIDYTVLSHGHIDHSGGLLGFLQSRSMPLTVFAGPGIFSARYVQYADGRMRFAGVPHTRENLTTEGAEFIFAYGPSQIKDNIWLSGPVPKVTDFETEGLNFIDANKQTDRFPDEIAVFVVQPKGLVVLTGCSHRGIVNTIKYGQRVTGVEKVYAVIGGASLDRASDWQREGTVDFLSEIDPDIIALNHCTGMEMQSILRSVFGSKIINANTGDIIEL